MEILYTDTNVFLRFLLQDNLKQAEVVEKKIILAKKGEIEMYCVSETIPELVYVLFKVYKVSRDEVAKYINVIIKTPYFNVEQRDIWIQVMKIYPQVNIDVVDIFLAVKAKNNAGEVFSFDHDFKKLSKFF